MFYPLLQHENKGSYTRIKAIERISIGSIAAIISFTKEKYSIVPVELTVVNGYSLFFDYVTANSEAQ